jgi:hypothetical protein
MNDQDIIQEAVEQLYKTTGIQANWHPGPPHLNAQLDGELDLTVNGRPLQFLLEVKNELRQYQLPDIERIAEQHQPLLLLVYRLFPAIKEKLRALNIAYLDGAGNIFINRPDTHIWIDGQKLQPHQQKPQTNRAFTRKGLETVFHLLLKPQDINAPYRQLAAKTGTALGNINNVMAGLQEAGFIINITEREKMLNNKKELLNRWITGYQQILKPALFIGNYIFYRNDTWRMVQPMGDTVWGGEAAAEIITDYLKAEKLTIYTNEAKAQLIRNWRLVPDENGPLAIYQKFWNDQNQQIAPPLLVYVDLLLTNDPRCIETAQQIYNQYLKDEFES